jgi:membrane protein
MRPRAFFTLIKDSFLAWKDDYASSLGASIAFYTIFSIAPLLIIVIAVAGFVWGEEAVTGEIIRQLGGLVGTEGASGIQSMIKSADKPTQGFFATLVSVIILMVGATSVFAELQSALDRIWQVPNEQKSSGLWELVRARLLSFGLVLGLGFLLLVSLVASSLFAALGQWSSGLFPGWELLLQMVNMTFSLGITVVLFAAIYKFMPQATIAWRDVWVGAAVTAILFEIGKAGIGLYLGKSSTISSLTAAGSLIVVLIWVYYAAQIFLLGAEFTWCYANRYGSRSRTGTLQGTEPEPH